MKRLIFVLSVALVAAFAAAPVHADPNAFYTYEEGMKPVKGNPMAVEWQKDNEKEIAAATASEVLAAFVKDAESAAKLLAQLKSAYETHPLVMTQIAAVTQWVMNAKEEPCFFCFWKPSPAAGRKVWVAALKAKKDATDDDYIKTFCKQQLELCE